MTEDMHEERLHAAEAFGNAIVSFQNCCCMHEGLNPFLFHRFIQRTTVCLLIGLYVLLSLLHAGPITLSDSLPK